MLLSYLYYIIYTYIYIFLMQFDILQWIFILLSKICITKTTTITKKGRKHITIIGIK